jgi:hypothetical protein
MKEAPPPGRLLFTSTTGGTDQTMSLFSSAEQTVWVIALVTR